MSAVGNLDGNDGFTAWGWACDTHLPDLPLVIEFQICNENIGHVLADQPRPDLQQAGIGRHAFSFRLPRTMGEGEFFTARIAGTDYALQGSPMPRAAPKSIGLLAGDIVNQCNLRCPFCIVDYSNVPGLNMMSHQIYKKMIELLPKIATPGNLWLSCLHEPTMHTQFIDFVEEVPEIFRDRISFTTNLSRRMDPSLLVRLAGSGIHQIRISFDSLNPNTFSILRKKAKFEIFMKNLLDLSAALTKSTKRPRLHFITMPFKNNYHELPDIIRYGRDLGADSHEVRYIYYMPHLARWGKDNILNLSEWEELRRSLTPLASDTQPGLVIGAPAADTIQQFNEERDLEDYVARENAFGGAYDKLGPIPDPAIAGPLLPDTDLQLRMRWDGLIVPANAPETHFRLNIGQLDKPGAYFDALRDAAGNLPRGLAVPASTSS